MHVAPRSLTNVTSSARLAIGPAFVGTARLLLRATLSLETNLSFLCYSMDTSIKKQTSQDVVVMNGVHAASALIDPGTADCSINLKLAQQLGLNVTKGSSTTRLANESPFKVHGSTEVNLAIKSEIFSCRLAVVDSPIADITIGMHFRRNHKVASLARGGLRPPITFISPGRGACCSIFQGCKSMRWSFNLKTFPLLSWSPVKLLVCLIWRGCS